MSDTTTKTLVVLTFVGMVGLYVGAAIAARKAQDESTALQNNPVVALLGALGVSL